MDGSDRGVFASNKTSKLNRKAVIADKRFEIEIVERFDLTLAKRDRLHRNWKRRRGFGQLSLNGCAVWQKI